jgi:hypothetical protein
MDFKEQDKMERVEGVKEAGERRSRTTCWTADI